MKRSLSCLLVVASLVGCTSLGLVQPPGVTLVNLQFTDLTVFETTGRLTLRLTNENPEALTIEGGAFTLFLNGAKVGKGLTSELMEVPSFESTVQDVPIYINNLALANRLIEILEQPQVDYRIRARLRLKVPYGTRRLNSEYRGTFSANERESPRSLVPGQAVDGGK